MDVDPDISRWVLEFVTRKVFNEDLLHRLFSLLPVSDNDSRLKKTILLKKIESEALDGSVSEKILDSLEIIVELDKKEGFIVLDSLKTAYCAVAVDCTVRFMEETGNKEGSKYFDAVNRIWRGRIGDLERLEEVGLVSTELRHWRKELEAAISDDDVCRNVLVRNTRNEALKAVRVYVNEAWKIMGPSFLELAAKEQGKELSNAPPRSRFVEINGNHVNQLAPREQVRGSSNVRRDVETSGNHANELAPRQQVVASSIATRAVETNGSCTNELAPTELVMASSIGPRAVETNGNCANELAAREQVGASSIPPMAVETNGNHVNELGVNDTSKTRDEDHAQERAQGKETRQGSGMLKRKHVGGPRRRNKGRAKITEIEEEDLEPSPSKYDPLPTPEVNKVREELRSSMLELHAVVKDPLPDALRLAERVASELASKSSCQVNVSEKQTSVDPQSSGVDKSIEALQANEVSVKAVQINEGNTETVQALDGSTEAAPANEENMEDVHRNEDDTGNQYLRHRVDGPKPGLMERNYTAHTYEWNESIDASPEQRSSGPDRIHQPSPKSRALVPLKRPGLTKFVRRRKIKRWSLLEEDTLRTAVQKFGKGNWKLMLNAYRDIFEERTEVDLKDKWRNMTK